MCLESEFDENKSFANWLLDIIVPDIYLLIKAVYSNIEQENLTDNFLQDRMLLSAQNDVQDIN
ncbi:14022_t:CDS:2, partial [Gigaspora margarita]